MANTDPGFQVQGPGGGTPPDEGGHGSGKGAREGGDVGDLLQGGIDQVVAQGGKGRQGGRQPPHREEEEPDAPKGQEVPEKEGFLGTQPT